MKVTSFKNQRGVATLITAVVLMLAVFGITYYLSETVLNETRFVADDIRGKQAFQAAQSGIEYAKALDIDSLSCGDVASSSSPSFTLYVCEDASVSGMYQLRSTGFSDDSTVRRVITYYLASQPGEVSPPEVPIVSKGTATFSGTVTAINNEVNLTVWTGNAVDLNGAVDTYISIDGKDDQLSTTDDTYGPDVILGDLNLANADPDDVIQSFYGKQDLPSLGDTMELVDIAAGVIPCPPPAQTCTTGSSVKSVYFGDGNDASRNDISELVTTTDLTDSANAFAWDSWAEDTGYDIADSSSPNYLASIDGAAEFTIDLGPGKSFDLSGSKNYIGTPDEPVMIVVDGTVDLPSNTVIFGTVVAKNVVMNGNTTIFGGLVAINDTTAFDTAGTNFVKMDKVTLGNVTLGGEGIGPVQSSWRDWQ